MVSGPREAIALILSSECAQGDRRPLLRLAGQPLVRHALRAAGEARSVRRVVVWTDREEEAEEVTDTEVVRFPWGPALTGIPPMTLIRQVLERIAPVTEALLVILPSQTPIRPTGSVQAALEAFRPDTADCLTVLFHEKGNLGRLCHSTLQLLRKDLRQRQDLEPVYADAGAVYVTTPVAVQRQKNLLGATTQGLVLDGMVGYEVRDELDARIAERWLQGVCRA